MQQSPTKTNIRGSGKGLRTSGKGVRDSGKGVRDSNSSRKSKKYLKLSQQIGPFYQLIRNLLLENQQFDAWQKLECVNPFSIQKLKDYNIKFLQGYRIYAPDYLRNKAKRHIMIISRDNKTSFIVLSPEIKKQDIKDYQIQDFKSWKGIRYVKNEQIYMGQFKYFHRQSQDCVQIIKISHGARFELSEVCSQQLAQCQKDLYCIYQGEYFNDMRQLFPLNLKKKRTKKQETVQSQSQKTRSIYQLQPPQKEGQKTAKLTYYELNGQRKFSLPNIQYIGGTLNCDAVIHCHQSINKANNKKNVKTGSFVNGFFSNSQFNKTNNTENHYLSYLGMTMSDNIVKTLEPRQWLNPNILTYFLRRVEFAVISKSIQHPQHHQHHQHRQHRKNFFVQPVNFLQTLKSKSLSQSDINQAYQKIDTNWMNSYRFMGLFPFELFGLTLIPYNRDKSHFALAAVLVQTIINQKQLKNAKITIFDLDSIYKDKLGEQRLKEWLQREISFIKIGYEKKIYQKALKEVTIENIASLNFPQQNNGYDCGLWVCIYGYFLYKRYVCYQDITKLTKMPEKNLQKLREFLKRAIATQEGDFIQKVQKIILQKDEKVLNIRKTTSRQT